MRFKLKNWASAVSCTIITIAATDMVHPAFALDANTFIEQLEKSAQERGNVFTYESKQEVSGGILLTNVKIEDKEENATSEIGELFFENPSANSNEGLRLDGLDATDYTHTRSEDGEERTVTASKLSAENVFLPNVADRSNPLWPAEIGSLEISDLEFSSDENDRPTVIRSGGLTVKDLESNGKNTFTLGSFELEPATGEIKAEGNTLDLGFTGISIRDLERFSERGFDIGSLEIGSLTIVGEDKEGRDIDLKFNGGSMTNLYVADPYADDQPLISEKPLEATLNSLNLKLDGKEFMGWEKGKASYTYSPEASKGTGSVSLDTMFFDFGAAPLDDESRKGIEQIRALGYERLGLNINGTGSWNLASGLLSIEGYRFEFIDAGALEMELTVSGYTEEVARSINKIANQVNSEDDPQQAQFKNMQLLAAISSLALQDLKISVEDASLLNKVIGLQAQQLGKDSQEVAGIVAPMASIMLAPFQVPEFAASVTAALSTFMQGNKTITATAKPEGGLVVTEMIALGSGVQAGQIQPAEVINRLNLQVTAE